MNAEPYEHVAIDNFLPDDVARRIAASFPGLDDIKWRLEGPGDSAHSGDRRIEKVTTGDEEQFPPFVRLMMMQLQSGIFCNFLDKLTGHQYLLPDPNHNGCGLHSTGPGGRLMLHIDASRHPNKRLNQLINCIYYCTPDWQEDWGAIWSFGTRALPSASPASRQSSTASRSSGFRASRGTASRCLCRRRRTFAATRWRSITTAPMQTRPAMDIRTLYGGRPLTSTIRRRRCIE